MIDWLTGKKDQSRMTPRILEVETTWNTFLLIGEELISNECFFEGAGGDGAVWR